MSARAEGKVFTRFTCDVCGHSVEIPGAWSMGFPPDGDREHEREGVPWARILVTAQGSQKRDGMACSGHCAEVLAGRLHGDIENDPSRPS